VGKPVAAAPPHATPSRAGPGTGRPFRFRGEGSIPVLRSSSNRGDDPHSIRALGAGVRGGIDALFEEAGAGAQDLAAILERDSGVEARRVDVEPQAVLGQAQAQRRSLQHVLGHRAAGRFQGIELDHFGHEADGQRTLGRDHAPRHHHLGSDAAADRARQEVADSDVAAGQPDLHHRDVELHVARRDAHVAGEREGKSAARRRAVREAHDWLRTAAHAQEYFADLPLHAHADDGTVADGTGSLQIVAGAERTPGAAQDHDAHAVSALQRLEIVQEFIAHPGRDRVEPIGPVQTQPVDGALAGDRDRRVVHAADLAFRPDPS